MSTSLNENRVGTQIVYPEVSTLNPDCYKYTHIHCPSPFGHSLRIPTILGFTFTQDSEMGVMTHNSLGRYCGGNERVAMRGRKAI